MNNQNTTFIDVTRTWLPIDPNAFPDGLQMAKEGPEDRVPVMAYKGYNFLPTSYGYKSYFGTNQVVGISALVARVDELFVYQNDSFDNIFLALCDSGIWYKSGTTAGVWVQALVLPSNIDTDIHFDWSYCIINDDLYVYRQNQPSYQKISSSAGSPGFTLTSVVPSFLNMEAQQGIFRAGARLGFWDSADSTAWSNLDDFADFTPSLETLANATTFSQVVGRIVTIKSHGNGFIIYATKSAVFVQEDPESLFQWKPTRILDVAGIAYRHEVTPSVPDSIHYVYTNIGLFKITNASPEIMVPEVTDYLKDSAGPKYLKVLEGRYLAIQSLDPNYINGIAQFTDEEIPETVILFPGANLNLDTYTADAQTQGGAAFCPIASGLSNGAFLQPEDGTEGSLYRPVYTAYLSDSGNRDPENIEWVATPCTAPEWPDGTPYPMSPSEGGSLSRASTDATNKREVAGSDAYLVGGWTIERFVAAQSAIWKLEDIALREYISAIVGRGHSSSKQEYLLVDTNSTVNYDCDLGNFVTEYTAPQFGYSPCEFWLTRYAIGAINVRMRGSLTERSEFIPSAPTPYDAGATTWQASGPSGIISTNTDENVAARLTWDSVFGAGSYVSMGMYLVASGANSFGQPTGYVITASGGAPTSYSVAILLSCPSGSVPGGGPGVCTFPDRYLVTTATNVFNVGLPVAIPPTPDTGYCTLTGWESLSGGAALGGSCTEPPSLGDARQAPMGAIPIISDDGTFCSEPFEPFTIPGTPDQVINWPDQTVTIPSGSYFLQVGSVAPLYPIFEGALIYDMHLKKWGKYKGRHRQLLDYSPINSYAPSEQSYSRFGIMGGVLAEEGFIRVFDEFPADSTITYGKVGYYRQGTTAPQEVRIHMKERCTCDVAIETSLTGKNLTTGLVTTSSFVDTAKMIAYGGYPGSWQNIKITGRFDISYIEYRGIINGKR